MTAIFNRMSGLHGTAHLPLKQLMSWGDHLSVDRPSIDAQHEGIFRIAMEVADAWRKRGNPAHLKALAERLFKALESHFRDEERLLEEIGYTKLAEHKAEHGVMLDELRVIRDRLDRMESGTAAMVPGFLVHNYILGITVGHICASDMDYCLFARAAAGPKEKVQPLGKCPFCESVDVKTFECDVGVWAASCSCCKTIGPFSPSEDEAVARWNRCER